MLSAQRRQEILKLVQSSGGVTVADLSRRFGTSEVTIRKDLQRLERQGLLKRTHGGALANSQSGVEATVADRALVQRAEKRQIAARAAEQIRPGDVILLGDGTTTLEVARCLKEVTGITVITNSWLILAELAGGVGPQVVALGGMLRSVTLAFVGPLTVQALAGLRADRAFIAVDGLSAAFGASTPNMLESEVHRAMLQSAKQSIVLADGSKFGLEFLYQIAALDEIDTVICDASAPDDQLAEAEAAGVEVLRAVMA